MGKTRGEGRKKRMQTELIIFILIAVILSIVISGASYVLAIRRPTGEKVGAYECGFTPFSDSRQKFEVRFFLVGILFIIFDLEIAMVFP
jgi:NADH-quinone oxidoreductase subunit A